MPIELLKAIADRPLPLTITKSAEIDKLRVLRAAGYVAVMLPSVDTNQSFARVLHIHPKRTESCKRDRIFNGIRVGKESGSVFL